MISRATLSQALTRALEIMGRVVETGLGHELSIADLALINAFCKRVLDEPQTITIPMRLRCPTCHRLHIDEGEFATKAHHTHACQFCGETWRPAIVATVGVQFLPGFKNEKETP